MNKLKRFWHWIWNSNSPLSWIASFVLAFIIVRFIFYPLVGLILATSLPLVVVESNSMNHFGEFDLWWQSQEDNYKEFHIEKGDASNWAFKGGLEKGDIIMIQGRSFDKLKIGDVIVFSPKTQNKAIIHRIVNIDDDNYLETKGDSNIGQISMEKEIRPNQIEGVAIARVPYLGWIKLFFVDTMKSLF